MGFGKAFKGIGKGIGRLTGNLTGGLIGKSDAERNQDRMLEAQKQEADRQADLYRQQMEGERKRRKEEARLKGMLRYEEKLYAKGYRYIAGIDEAGRGPVAGPVTVAAVILPIRPLIYGLNDSKKVSPKKREELFDMIINEAIAVSCINFSEEDIDRYDIYHATQLAMYTAVKTLDISPQAVLIDAMPLPDLEIYHESIVGGDAQSQSIAAASIIAKVTRDRIMEEYDRQYPRYGFAEHKGYLTQAHKDAIAQYGPCPIHRKSFEPVKSMVGFSRDTL